MIHKNAQNGHVLITMSVFVIYLIYYIYKGLGTYESETYQIRLAAAIHLRHLLGCCRNLCPYTGTRWLDNFSIISFRMLLAALITGIWILFYNRHLFYVHRRDFWLFIGSGMIGMTALSVFYNISVTKGSLALSAVLLAMSPVFVLFLAAIFFHEPITRHKLTCVTLALIGCVLVSGVLESNGLSWSITGILCGILASFFYAVYGIISKKVTQKGYHFLTITFYGTLFSGMTMLPFSNIHSLSSMIVSGQRTTFFILIIHALVSSVLPYALYSLSMRYMEAGKASILASSEPAAACYSERYSMPKHQVFFPSVDFVLQLLL